MASKLSRHPYYDQTFTDLNLLVLEVRNNHLQYFPFFDRVELKPNNI